jgi:hypothetical protein
VQLGRRPAGFEGLLEVFESRLGIPGAQRHGAGELAGAGVTGVGGQHGPRQGAGGLQITALEGGEGLLQLLLRAPLRGGEFALAAGAATPSSGHVVSRTWVAGTWMVAQAMFYPL